MCSWYTPLNDGNADMKYFHNLPFTVWEQLYGLFPLPDSDPDSDSDSDSKPYGYIVLCRTCFH